MRESLRGSGAFYDEENEGFPGTQRLSNIACTRRRAAVIGQRAAGDA